MAQPVPIPHSAARQPPCLSSSGKFILLRPSSKRAVSRGENADSFRGNTRVTPVNAADSRQWHLGRREAGKRDSEFAYFRPREPPFTRFLLQWLFSCMQIPTGGGLERGHIQCASGKHGSSAPQPAHPPFRARDCLRQASQRRLLR